MPQISIIVPVYRCEKTLARCVDSVLRQTLDDWELLLVDDGSPDQSGALCDAYAGRDGRIRALHQQNGGAAAARNAGIAAARGTYLMFLDSDDWMEPDMARRLLETARESGCDLVVCGFFRHFGTDAVQEDLPQPVAAQDAASVRRYVTHIFPDGMLGYPWNKLYRAALFADDAVRFPRMARYEDGVFALAFLERTVSLTTLPQALYHYSEGDLSAVFQKNPPDVFACIRELALRYFETLDRWGIADAQPREQMLTFLLNGVVVCVDASFSPDWHMDMKQKRAYYRTLRADPLVKEGLARCRSNDRYSRVVLGLFRHGCFFGVWLAAWGKLFLKKHFRPVFAAVRRRLRRMG